jgi:hypothetical protein
MQPQKTMQAPEAQTGPADSSADTEGLRKQIAKRDWLGADGNPVEAEEDAVSARYTYLEDGKSYTWSPTTDDSTTRMCAIFGALTLMGNLTNTWKNEKGDRADSPIDVMVDRFALMANEGKWIDRSQGAVGARVDKDVLAEAMTQCAIAKGSTKWGPLDGNDAAAVGEVKAKYREALEDATFVRVVRKVPEINAKYAELVGTSVKTLEEVL